MYSYVYIRKSTCTHSYLFSYRFFFSSSACFVFWRLYNRDENTTFFITFCDLFDTTTVYLFIRSIRNIYICYVCTVFPLYLSVSQLHSPQHFMLYNVFCFFKTEKEKEKIECVHGKRWESYSFILHYYYYYFSFCILPTPYHGMVWRILLHVQLNNNKTWIKIIILRIYICMWVTFLLICFLGCCCCCYVSSLYMSLCVRTSTYIN